jgi:hypothetical protein
MFGPAIVLNNSELFDILDQYKKKVTIYYRTNFDKEHPDKKHFKIAKNIVKGVRRSMVRKRKLRKIRQL